MRDIVIIGAGWSGLGTAKTYLQIVGSDADLAILEASSTVGGVWAEERLYPELRSNNLLGTYEFADFPMAGFGVEKGQHIPGKSIQAYLTKYAEKFNLLERIRFNTKVKTAEYRGDDGWLLTLEGDAGETIECRKLIMATGLASNPILPAYKGSDEFGAPLFHVKDLHKNAEDVVSRATSNDAHRVTVLGGSKSAFDAVYMLSSKGVKVDWVIRKSGFGPTYMSPPYVTPLGIWAERLLTTRLFSWLNPCIWGDADGYAGVRGLLHGTRLGRKLVDTFFWIVGKDTIDLTGLPKHEETKKLIPWTPFFWQGAGAAILNYPTDFYAPIKDGTVKIYIADVDHLSPSTIHLADGISLSSSALIISNGWKPKPAVKFLPEGIEATLGLPHKASWPDELLPKADLEILTKFPSLAARPTEWLKEYCPPPLKDHDLEELNRPARLYRLMIPPTIADKRSLVFINATQSHNTALIITIQSVWATAYLTGKLSLETKTPEERAACGQTLQEELEYDALVTSRFKAWRYPLSRNKLASDFVFDAMPYFDMLVADLGLNRWRKGGGPKEWFTPYTLQDYRDIAKEWVEASGTSE